MLEFLGQCEDLLFTRKLRVIAYDENNLRKSNFAQESNRLHQTVFIAPYKYNMSCWHVYQYNIQRRFIKVNRLGIYIFENTFPEKMIEKKCNGWE